MSHSTGLFSEVRGCKAVKVAKVYVVLGDQNEGVGGLNAYL